MRQPVEQTARDDDAAGVLLERFARFLRVERGLGVGTVAGYLGAVGPFVMSRRRGDGLDLVGIVAGDVFAFLTRCVRGDPEAPRASRRLRCGRCCGGSF